jgi:hypothetical protein
MPDPPVSSPLHRTRKESPTRRSFSGKTREVGASISSGGGVGVPVGGRGVFVAVGGSGVLVAVGGTGVFVAVGGIGVLVAVGGTGVLVAVDVGVKV